MIRHSTPKDLDDLMNIYEHAKTFMATNGNPNQWGPDYPTREIILSDIQRGVHFTLERDGKLLAGFVFIIGPEPTYAVIRKGAWPNDDPYGTIHRLAAAEGSHGIFREVLNYCRRQIPTIRADTHADNKIMLRLLEKEGFHPCGEITVEDGTPRSAFIKTEKGGQ